MSRSSSVDPQHHLCLFDRLLRTPPDQRATVMLAALSFVPSQNLDEAFALGPIRAAFGDYWESTTGRAVPVVQLRAVLEPPLPIKTLLEFQGLTLARDAEEIVQTVEQVLWHLKERMREIEPSPQSHLFDEARKEPSASGLSKLPVGTSVGSLAELLELRQKFSTIYADPPWQYDNESSRGAAANHYRTMSVEEICQEPVRELVEDDAHLHLWTTNSFLSEAFRVIEAWGFRFKSCLVWVKDEIGMGNYWRVSHEFLMLGVRGNLTFRDRTLPSWIQAPRTIHSHKPAVIRSLVERVSPGPYLELYGREELPDTAWTVFGNQVERRLF
jgi:N6-adenosine-specific RNA methylase IME4